jgi:predicted RNA-binding protein YlxR (DUF448 family)
MTAATDRARQRTAMDRERERACACARHAHGASGRGLIRFVVGPDGEAVPDLKRKLPGRGVWVTATRDALEEAIKRKALARGFKRDVRLRRSREQHRAISERAVLDALAMAGKAGLVAAGFTKGRGGAGAMRRSSPSCMRPRLRRRGPQARCGRCGAGIPASPSL